MVNISQETEGKLKRKEIIQVEPNRDERKYKKRRNEPSYEIVKEILSMLPTKSVVKFSCVSKQWFRATSDAYFRDLHYSRMGPDPKPEILLLRYSKNENEKENVINMYLPSSGRVRIRLESDIPLYRLITRQNYELCNACNGLLCFVSRNPEDPIIVCNPLTKEHLTLPRSPPFKKSSDCFVALGFCPSSRRYKIFRLSFPPWSIKEGLLEVCDAVGGGSSSNPWRTISPYLNMTPSGRPLYLDGKIHWMVLDQPFWKCGPSHSVIVSVDVESEKYKYISIPHTGVAFHLYRETNILELEGRLSVAALYYGDESIYFWALKDFERGRWDLQYICKHLSFPMRDVLLPAGAGEIIDLFSYDNIIYIKLRYRCRWICYDTTEAKSKFPLIPKLPGIPHHGDLLLGFFPSLLLPKQFTS